jgi:hypothetical protein
VFTICVVVSLIGSAFSLYAQEASPGIVQITTKGRFWATRDVNNARYEIELTVFFNEKSGEIIRIDYVPSPAHSTSSRYHTRWITAERDRPGTYRNYITALIGMKAEDVAKFSKPTGHAREGNHGITGLNLTGVDAISGATGNGRNLVSSVVAASQIFLSNR